MFLKITQLFFQDEVNLHAWKHQMKVVHKEMIPVVQRRQSRKTALTEAQFCSLLMHMMGYAVFRFVLFAIYFFIAHVVPLLLHAAVLTICHVINKMMMDNGKEDTMPISEQISSMKIQQLRDTCRSHGLKTSRCRDHMIRSLVAYHIALRHSKTKDDLILLHAPTEHTTHNFKLI